MGNAARDQLPLRWQHAGDVDEYNVDVLTLQDQHMGELCSTMLKRVGPAARGIVNWFSLVGPPQRPFDEDPELFDLQGLAFPHAACGVSLDIVQYLAVGTRTAQSAVPTYTGAWDLTHEGTAHAPVCSTLGQVSRVLYTAFFHEGGGARNAPPPTPFATRFARDVAVLALLRPLADKRVENVEGRLQTRRIYAPRLVAGTATPAPNAACDKDVAGGAPHQRENKKLWLAVTVAQLASQPKKSHANPRLVTAFGYELPPFPNSPPGPPPQPALADDFLSAAAMDVESERPADYVPEIARAVADHMDDFNKVLNSFRCVVPDGLMVFIHEAFLTKPTAKPDRGSDVLPQGKKVFDADARPTYPDGHPTLAWKFGPNNAVVPDHEGRAAICGRILLAMLQGFQYPRIPLLAQRVDNCAPLNAAMPQNVAEVFRPSCAL
eukprot:tig00020734_g13608.t1